MSQDFFHLKPWTPALQQTARHVIDAIHATSPELEVLFMGSAALEIPGENDIDLDILCNKNDIPAYTQKLTPLLGKPKEAQDAAVFWEFTLQGTKIDAILSDPTISHVPQQRQVFEILRAHPELREEYKKLKEACDGMPRSEYTARKKHFLNTRVATYRRT